MARPLPALSLQALLPARCALQKPTAVRVVSAEASRAAVCWLFVCGVGDFIGAERDRAVIVGALSREGVGGSQPESTSPRKGIRVTCFESLR